MKVAINKRYGGFGLSDAAMEKLIEWGIPSRSYEDKTPIAEDELVIYDRELTPKGTDHLGDLYYAAKEQGRIGIGLFTRYVLDNDSSRTARTHPLVIRVIEEMGSAANGRFASLRIVEIPDDVEWYIDEYDGIESIHEEHKSWG